MDALADVNIIAASELTSDIVRAAIGYWRDKRRNDALPCYVDFDPIEIPRLLPHLLVKEVRRDPWDFRYRIVGTTVREHSRENWTGKWMSEVDGQDPGSAVFRVQRAAVERGDVMVFRPPYVGPHKGFKFCEAAVTPWSGSNGNPDRLVIAVDFLAAV